MKSAKKSLGQNFLIDKNVVKKIINIVDIRNKNVLEIVEEKIKRETYEGENYIWGSILGVKSEIVNDPNSLFNKRLKQITLCIAYKEHLYKEH